MSSALESRIGFLVRTRLGSGVPWRIYDRELQTPMNFALERAERQLRRDLTVVWVDGGYPDLFTLAGLGQPIVVFSTRYLELTALVRTLIVEDWMEDLRADLAARTCMTILAELALLARRPELAVRLFLRSKLGGGITIPSQQILQELELTPISERYMVTWFFGLLHEVGHSDVVPDELQATGLLSADSLEREMREQLASFAIAHELDLQELLTRVRGDDPRHPLTPAHLRGEVAADLFAASTLLQATVDILAEVRPDRPLEPLAYATEIYFFLNVIAVMQRCRAVIEAAAPQRPTPGRLEELLIEPAATGTRFELVRVYLVFALSHYYSGSQEPTNDDVAAWRDAVEDAMGNFAPRLQAVESGLSSAMRVAFFDDEPLETLLADAADEHEADIMFKLDTRALCDRGASLGIEDDSLARLAQLAA